MHVSYKLDALLQLGLTDRFIVGVRNNDVSYRFRKASTRNCNTQF